jgi:serine/threonine-protein kinase HipA
MREGPFLRDEKAKRIPPILELPKLLSASERFIEEKDTDEDLRLLIAPGSSLGGEQPHRRNDKPRRERVEQ